MVCGLVSHGVGSVPRNCQPGWKGSCQSCGTRTAKATVLDRFFLPPNWGRVAGAPEATLAPERLADAPVSSEAAEVPSLSATSTPVQGFRR